MKRMGIVIAAVMLLSTLPLSSQQVEASYEFEQALQQMLRAESWSLEEIQKLLKEEVDWEQARIRDAQVIAICLAYAKDAGGEIGPYEQARMAMEVMTMAREMRAFGFGEPEILRTSLNGTRGVLGDLEKLREQERLRIGEDNGIGELMRSRFQEQLQTAMNLEARHMVQARVRAEKNSRPGDLLVPPGPQGPGGSAR